MQNKFKVSKKATYPNRHLFVQSQQWKHQKNV